MSAGEGQSFLAGRRALVTGAGKRIGREIVRALAQRGAAVAVHYRGSAGDAASLVAEITAQGGRAVAVSADLISEADTATLIPGAAEALGGPIDVLVNNASTFAPDSATVHDRAGWDSHMQVNLRAPILLSQALALGLPPDAEGAILNLIDQRVWKLNPTFFTYTLSKSALWTATRTLAQALAPRIRVNAIGPGPTLANVHQQGDAFSTEAAATLLGRGSPPVDIAHAALFLLEARSVTGQMIAVDAGQHLVWQTPDVVDT